MRVSWVAFLQKAFLSATVKGGPPSTGILQRSTLLCIQNMAVLFLFFLCISSLREELALCGSLARSHMFFFSKIIWVALTATLLVFFPPKSSLYFFPSRVHILCFLLKLSTKIFTYRKKLLCFPCFCLELLWRKPALSILQHLFLFVSSLVI